jgi:hypothetical protein
VSRESGAPLREILKRFIGKKPEIGNASGTGRSLVVYEGLVGTLGAEDLMVRARVVSLIKILDATVLALVATQQRIPMSKRPDTRSGDATPPG